MSGRGNAQGDLEKTLLPFPRTDKALATRRFDIFRNESASRSPLHASHQRA